MTKSLNQAFIKAYSKGQASEANRAAETDSASLAASQASDPFLMRFDTATISIPSPHIGKTDRLEAVAQGVPRQFESTAKRQTLDQPRPVSQPVPDSQPVVEPTEQLRDSIASQMLQAGAWEDQQIDAFIGGFPMISSAHAPNARPIAASARPVQPAQPVEETAPPPLSPLVREDSPKHPKAVATSESPRPESPVSESRRPESPNLEPPEAPALSHPIAPQSDNAADNPAPSESIELHHRGGEIFRLDRPSYADPPSAGGAAAAGGLAAADLDDSGDQSSMIGELSDSHTNLDIDGTPVGKVSSTPAVESARAVEEDLRQARVRIFNPVWEVDNLQWPAVCTELLQQRADSMERVAQNLISACQEGLQVLAVTSPRSGEGRTTVACCLAMLAGSRGLNIAIVDGDIETPSLSFQTNLELEQDWKAAIVNQVPLEEVAVHSIDDQVTLVPLLSPISHDEMASDDNRIAFMLQELSESFDLVIVDTGHMNSTRNLVTALGEQGIISAVVAVVDHRSSTPEKIESCLRRIRQTGIASIGLVENFAA